MKDNNINENVVEVNNLKAFYITNAYGIQRTVQAVDDISLSIKEGEIYGLAGESGCGKSSLMKVMMGAHKVPLTIVDGGIHYKLGNNQNIKTIDSQNNLNFKWIKGHNSHPQNERCDFLANTAAKKNDLIKDEYYENISKYND